jgi:hypothetical protein
MYALKLLCTALIRLETRGKVAFLLLFRELLLFGSLVLKLPNINNSTAFARDGL